MKIVFLGTPEIASDCLKNIIESKHEVLAVVTKLDTPKGRGNKLTPSEVKITANKYNIPVLQYKSVSKEGIDTIKKLKPDALVLVAFGQILSEDFLKIALPINLHGSLLPALRGPSPIQTAILNGLTETGLSVMKIEGPVDSGDILLQEKIKIDNFDTSKTLFKKAGIVGGKLLVKALDLIESGKYTWTKQIHENATFTKKLSKEEGQIDFNQPIATIINKIRAYNDDPVAYMYVNGEYFKVYFAKEFNSDLSLNNYKNGKIVFADSKKGLVVKCQDAFVEITELQAQNSKVMPAKSYLNGKKMQVGLVI